MMKDSFGIYSSGTCSPITERDTGLSPAWQTLHMIGIPKLSTYAAACILVLPVVGVAENPRVFAHEARRGIPEPGVGLGISSPILQDRISRLLRDMGLHQLETASVRPVHKLLEGSAAGRYRTFCGQLFVQVT
jgi:hypothetical protein